MSKKMRTRRRVLGTVTAVAAVGSLAVVPATPSYASANKVLKIEFWYQSSPGSTDLVGQWLNGVIPAFEKAHPGVTVESNYIDAPESDVLHQAGPAAIVSIDVPGRRDGGHLPHLLRRNCRVPAAHH